MKIIKQKTKQDCFPCSLSNITNIPYQSARRAVRKIDKFYSPSRKRGIKTQKISKVLDYFNIKYFVPKDGNYSTMASVCKGCKGIIVVVWKDGSGGHALGWNGFRILEPTSGISFTKYDYYKKYEKHINYTFVAAAIETSLLRRLASLAYSVVDLYREDSDEKTLKEELKCVLDKALGWLSQKAKLNSLNTAGTEKS